jgi:hypothetical protein
MDTPLRHCKPASWYAHPAVLSSRRHLYCVRRYRFAFRRKLPPGERLLDLCAMQVRAEAGLK